MRSMLASTLLALTTLCACDLAPEDFCLVARCPDGCDPIRRTCRGQETTMTGSDVMRRYLQAKGLRGARLDAEMDVLDRALEDGADIRDYVRWLTTEVAYCLETHGDSFGASR